VLCCAVLCCAVLCCAVLCCAVLCCAVLCCAVPCKPSLGGLWVAYCEAGGKSLHMHVECVLGRHVPCLWLVSWFVRGLKPSSYYRCVQSLNTWNTKEEHGMQQVCQQQCMAH
jgi:hypothetical protein